jgi:PAS domain S-box-containing protein
MGRIQTLDNRLPGQGRTDAPAGKRDAARAWREAEQLIASLPNILIGLSLQWRVTRWNRKAAAVFGLEEHEAVGAAVDGLGLRWDWERLRRSLERCRSCGGSVRLDGLSFQRSQGSDGVLGLAINPLKDEAGQVAGFSITGADITERRILERQLAQAQNLRSIGQLASGIAHEINTPTQYVGDNIRFLQEAFRDLSRILNRYAELAKDLKTGSAAAEHFDRLEAAIREADLGYLMDEIPLAIRHSFEGVERIRKIVLAMKQFAHPGREEKTPVDLNAVVENTITVARNEWKYVADMVTELEPGLPPVSCHAAEINQVLLNIIINAAHAIEEGIKQGGRARGTITVATRLSPPWVEVRISDTGTGIPEAVRPRIFEPFFTTKEVGRGTGQGLAISHASIVGKHHGSLELESEEGRGTTFTIRLPLEEATE